MLPNTDLAQIIHNEDQGIWHGKVVEVVNTELFATEIVRTIVGSIGLILAVPIVTFLAVFYLKDYKPKHGHSHSHGHSHG